MRSYLWMFCVLASQGRAFMISPGFPLIWGVGGVYLKKQGPIRASQPRPMAIPGQLAMAVKPFPTRAFLILRLRAAVLLASRNLLAGHVPLDRVEKKWHLD